MSGENDGSRKLEGEKMEGGKSKVDSFFDKADSFMDGMEAVFKTQGKWRTEEILDANTSQTYWEITDGNRKFSADREEDARWLVQRLS